MTQRALQGVGTGKWNFIPTPVRIVMQNASEKIPTLSRDKIDSTEEISV